MIARRVLFLGAAVVAACSSHAADAGAPPVTASRPPIESGPALGWTFPLFTDKEGYRMLTLRGAEARILGPDRIDVTGFSAIVFSGDASERVDTVLLSPQASFFVKENRARGDSTVRLILSGKDPSEADDIEVLGRGWTYTYTKTSRTVSLAHDVRVTFHVPLNDILK